MDKLESKHTVDPFVISPVHQDQNSLLDSGTTTNQTIVDQAQSRIQAKSNLAWLTESEDIIYQPVWKSDPEDEKESN